MRLFDVILLCMICTFNKIYAIPLCLYFQCTSQKEMYYAFVWNKVHFSRVSDEYMIGFISNTCFDTYINCDAHSVIDSSSFVRSIDLDSIFFLSGQESSNQQNDRYYNPFDEKEILSSPKQRIIFSYPYVEGIRLYSMWKDVKKIDETIKKIVLSHSYFELDTLSEYVERKINRNSSLSSYDVIYKIYKFNDNKNISYNDKEKKHVSTKYFFRDDFKRYGCTEFLNVISNRYLLVRTHNHSLEKDDYCFHWIGIEKNNLSSKEINFLNELINFPLAPLDSSGKLIFYL
ncbi:MAG TPA: hypothetical protein VJZ04_05095 [Lachnospiraceae bacterium]|nr:hypothetical protein [Lachnospiraceae bacterium]